MTKPDVVSEIATVSADGVAQLVVLGGGLGGYTAAFRAADLGLDVTLIDSRATLGGVCLNVGCIPSKALLHLAKVIDEVRHVGEAGLTFGAPQVDFDGIRAFRDRTTGRLISGLAGLAKRRKVRVVTGEGAFTGPNEIEVRGPYLGRRDDPRSERHRRLRVGTSAPAVPARSSLDP
ncbi:FAD-dependent oxidoreductase [Sagittula sp.]|uniref:FAD-dependent oxidoreductase n=2 Tax=Sagittula sp. TaxID=2038081 RepID=UPI0035198A27